MTKIYDTIVIGMGASGVTALNVLSKAGKSVLGLEAADYIGGRVKTVNFGRGIVEIGAEWIHGERPSKVFDLANEYKIPIMQQDLTAETFRSDGAVLDSELLNELYGFCIDIVDYPPTVPEPLGDYITFKLKEHLRDRPEILNDEEFMTGFLDLMNLMVNNYESTTDWNEVSTASKYTPVDGYQHWSWNVHGYKTLFDILLNRINYGTGLPAEILLNHEVDNIEWSDDSEQEVTVICKDGSKFKSKNVIVTVSLGVLKDRHKTLFTPNLPEAKIKAIQHMTIGVMGKIILSFDTVWWPKNVTWYAFLWTKEDKSRITQDDAWITKIFGFSTPLGSENCLTFWTCGDSGKHIETLSNDVVKSKVMFLLRKFAGKTFNITEPTGIIRSYWYTNPLTRGSYTYDSLNFTEYPTARMDLGRPLNNTDGTPKVLFAGEATNEYHFSTVHGAVETGLLAANTILNIELKVIRSKI